MNPPYSLPPLGYDYDALEPALSAEILELHHAAHHRAYVDGANRALEGLAEMRASGDYRHVNQFERDLAFHLSGHVLHSIFWRNLAPNDGSFPSGKFGERIRAAFGSFDAFREQFRAAGDALRGAGWVALGWDATAGLLMITQIRDHQQNLVAGSLPLLVMDLWEHAYYLQYRNRRERWSDAFWQLVNWPDVGRRLDNAVCLDLSLDPVLVSHARRARSARR